MGGRGGSRSGGGGGGGSGGGGGGVATKEAPKPTSRDFNSSETQAIREYVATSTEINEFLRDKYITANQNIINDFKAQVAALDSAVTASGPLEAMTVYRATRFAPLTKILESGNFVGQTFSDKGFISTSKGGFLPYFQSMSTVDIRIRVPGGSRGIKTGSLNRGEREIILDRGSSFKITGASKSGGKWSVDVQLIQKKR